MAKKQQNKRIKLCLVSSSGGHYEQLKMLKPIAEKHDVFWVTENADYEVQADYLVRQIRPGKFNKAIILLLNLFISIGIWKKEKPDYVITTGTLAALPIIIIAKILRKKVIYIETFARIYDGTRAGMLMCKIADLFIIQWESLQEIYPNAVYGGSIY
jgi:beta-1,4-N-acetylglucosaminyltransferase